VDGEDEAAAARLAAEAASTKKLSKAAEKKRAETDEGVAFATTDRIRIRPL
jgi:hypothetical protein